MKSSNKKRSNSRRNHFGSSHRPANVISRNTVLESNGPIGHIRGTAAQLAEKYLAVSKDARHQRDHILAELCSQQAEHYIRLTNLAMQYEISVKEENAENESATPDKEEGTDPLAIKEMSAKAEEEKNEPATDERKKPTQKRRHLFIKKKDTTKPATEAVETEAVKEE